MLSRFRRATQRLTAELRAGDLEALAYAARDARLDRQAIVVGQLEREDAAVRVVPVTRPDQLRPKRIYAADAHVARAVLPAGGEAGRDRPDRRAFSKGHGAQVRAGELDNIKLAAVSVRE